MNRSNMMSQLGGKAAVMAAISQSNGTIKDSFTKFRDFKAPELSYATFYNWINRNADLRAAVEARLEVVRSEDGMEKAFRARKRYSAVRDLKKADCTDERAAEEIVAHEGDLEKAAEAIGTNLLEFIKRVNGDPKLIEAVKDGRSLRHMRIENDLYEAATGQKTMDNDQLRVALTIAKAKMGWTGTSEKDDRRTYDPSTVPDGEVGAVRPRNV